MAATKGFLLPSVPPSPTVPRREGAARHWHPPSSAGHSLHPSQDRVPLMARCHKKASEMAGPGWERVGRPLVSCLTQSLKILLCFSLFACKMGSLTVTTFSGVMRIK